MTKVYFTLLLIAFPLSLAGAAVSEQTSAKEWWPQFLGPRGNGTAPDKDLNFDWKKTPPKVVWKVPLGEGFSSFSIVGDRAFTMCKRGDRDIVVCLDTRDGKEMWTHDVAPSYIDKQKQGAGPRSTPTYHNGRLYCLMAMGELVCVTAVDGKRVWTANQFTDTGALNPAGEYFYWGVALFSLVEGDLVIVQPGGENNNSVAAYDKYTGKLAWTAGNDKPGNGSPQIITIGGRRQLVVPTKTTVLGLDPAKGTILWRYLFNDTTSTVNTTPVWTGDLLWVSAAYTVGAGVLEISGQGDTWTVKEKWRNKKSMQTLYASAMILDGYAYGCHGDIGAVFMKCVDLKTGNITWEERLEKRHWLMAVDGHILSWSEAGSLQVLEPRPTGCVVKAELPNLLADRKCWAAPAMADGRLFLRDRQHAMCIDLRKQ